MKIVFGDFCRKTFLKNDPDAAQKERNILEQVYVNFSKARQGYREGVLLVPISPEGLDCPIVQLKGGEYLFGKYDSRVEGEQPRKKTSVLGGEKMKAVSADVVLYHRDVLAEDNGVFDETCDYEIVTVLAKPCEGDQPMPVETLLYNHFHGDGGTQTNMTPEQFEKALRESFEFWKDKAMIYSGS